MHLKSYLGLATSLFSTMLSVTGEHQIPIEVVKSRRTPKSNKATKGTKSSIAFTVANFEGNIFEGSDGRRCYRVTIGSGSYYQDDHNPTCAPPFKNEFLVGQFDKIEDGKAIYNDGAYCKGLGNTRSGTVEVEEHTSISEIEVVFSEPSKCFYKTVIRVPSNTKAPKAVKIPTKTTSNKGSKGTKNKVKKQRHYSHIMQGGN